MNRVIAAVLAVTSCATEAQAQTSGSATDGPVLTLAQALDLAGASAPSVEAATAGVRAASAARQVAALRPNPTISTDIENVGGSRAYNIIEVPKQTVSVGLPVEMGGKRSARIAVADVVQVHGIGRTDRRRTAVRDQAYARARKRDERAFLRPAAGKLRVFDRAAVFTDANQRRTPQQAFDRRQVDVEGAAVGLGRSFKGRRV